MSFLARKGKIDVRGDEEQNAKLLKIIALLIEGGYYRARIKGLSPFDKIVGGMAWCIETCNYDLDVDLLFHDSLTIGQKISLTERIVQVLPLMKCPHAIEPHQIQGLDSIHIYPVVKWLMELAVEKRKEYKDEIRLISLDEFGRQFVQTRPKTDALDYIWRVKKHFCTTQDFQNSSDSKQESKILSKWHIPGSDSGEDLGSLRLKIAQMSQQLKFLEEQLLDGRKQKLECKSSLASAATKFEQLSSTYKASPLFSGSIEFAEPFQQLLQENDAHKERMNSFKHSCLKEESALEAKIKILQKKVQEPKKEEDDCLAAKHKEKMEKNRELSAKLSSCNRRVLILKKQLDDLPGQAELTQYQKRFVELYFQVSLNHHETLQFNNLFNSISNTKTYMNKEVSLLNSIAENIGRSLDSPRILSEFTHQLKEILENLDGNKQKLERNLFDANESRSKILAEINELKSVESKYQNLLCELSGKLIEGSDVA